MFMQNKAAPERCALPGIYALMCGGSVSFDDARTSRRPSFLQHSSYVDPFPWFFWCDRRLCAERRKDNTDCVLGERLISCMRLGLKSKNMSTGL